MYSLPVVYFFFLFIQKKNLKNFLQPKDVKNLNEGYRVGQLSLSYFIQVIQGEKDGATPLGLRLEKNINIKARTGRWIIGFKVNKPGQPPDFHRE